MAETGIKPFYVLFDTEELSPSSHDGALVMNSYRVELSGGAPAVADGCENASLACTGQLLASGLRGSPGFGLPASFALPDGFCADAPLTPAGPVVALYHADDSFRPQPLRSLRFCNALLTEWLAERTLEPSDVIAGPEPGTDAPVDLYDLELFAPNADPGFLEGYVRCPDKPDEWAREFRSSIRVSLRSLNASTDVLARDTERERLRTQALRDQLSGARGWRTAAGADVRRAVEAGADAAALERIAAQTVDPVLRLYRNATLSFSELEQPGGDAARPALHFVPEGQWRAERRAVKADQIVWARSPVRLDLGGGWTDTPPYTNLFGGAVTNVAVDLNGQPPIQVFVRPVAEPVIVFHSIELGEREIIREAGELHAYTDPSARFALPRAACVLLGVGPEGGGFELSMLAAVPKGSGLGTSSVLGGVMLAALFRFFGLEYLPDDLFLSVLELEQMLTTGGGWQDQIGGLAGGVKYIETRPGSHPRPLVHQLDPYLFEEPEFRNRMSLYYTGVTRLAKNILGEVVDRVNRREPAFLFTHEYLRALARDARSAIALRDYARLARVIRGSWRANRLIHTSTPNEEIDALLAATSEYCSGVKLLGAGGGGYALFLSETVAHAHRLRDALAKRSAASEAARLVDFSLSRPGLQVSVS
ncbi:MAG: hypothetical protein ACOC7V_16170 [Spirochaetota bacterium]